MNKIFKVKSFVLERTLHTHLNKLQKIICKIFKITPQLLYNYKIECHIDSSQNYLLNTIIQTFDGNKWLIVKHSTYNFNIIEIQNVVPIILSETYTPINFIILYSSFLER